MAKKVRSIHTCSECGYSCPKWLGRCPECGAWGTLVESTPVASPTAGGTLGEVNPSLGRAAHVAATLSGTPRGLVPASEIAPITALQASSSATIATGIGELDRVLGSGIVPGSVVLLAGEPGVGKSTLLLEVAHRWTQATPADDQAVSRRVLYATAEESAGQVRGRAERTGALSDQLFLAAENELDVIFSHVEKLRPGLIVVDSVQTMHATGVEGVAGGVAQSRAVTAALTTLAKTTGIPVLLVGHVTKDGAVAGPRVLEHLVDVVLHFEGDRQSSLRFLRGMKNRFGATDEVGCFEQTSSGIREVPDPSGLFLSHRESDQPDGSVITVAMDGVRPLLAEVQALAVPGTLKNPRRVVTGLDAARVPMVLAVLMARAGVDTSSHDVYVATVGGMRINEPATDLAVALATLSTLTRTPLPNSTVVIGELGLAGEVRRIPELERRLREAARLGFRRAIVPRDTTRTRPETRHPVKGMDVHAVSTLTEAIAAAGLAPTSRHPG